MHTRVLIGGLGTLCIILAVMTSAVISDVQEKRQATKAARLGGAITILHDPEILQALAQHPDSVRNTLSSRPIKKATTLE